MDLLNDIGVMRFDCVMPMMMRSLVAYVPVGSLHFRMIMQFHISRFWFCMTITF